ncbi:unnamed protein product [Protopolystoma xenopodis]|uniref:Uncharacterized protein n=1 Tax=Protopolystoma xenopodis TaxID=117903 RepID=A0A448XAY7_9PLAT|nr:unnamed protein product [Protopolystoma xenopodis]
MLTQAGLEQNGLELLERVVPLPPPALPTLLYQRPLSPLIPCRKTSPESPAYDECPDEKDLLDLPPWRSPGSARPSKPAASHINLVFNADVNPAERRGVQPSELWPRPMRRVKVPSSPKHTMATGLAGESEQEEEEYITG